MKHILARFCLGFVLLTQNLQAKNAPSFLLSSVENMLSNNDVLGLEGIHSFVFFFFLQMEKEEDATIIDFFNQELSKIGQVVKKDILTGRGVDLECFSHPSLCFSLTQLVDNNHHPLPTLQANLRVSGTVEVCRNKTLIQTNIGTWNLYLNKKNQTTLSALKSSVSALLKEFETDFIKANGTDKKPVFFITYGTDCFLSRID
jgi:hypothetical protein